MEKLARRGAAARTTLGGERRRRWARIAALGAFLILASTPAAVSAPAGGRPVSEGTWFYEGKFGSDRAGTWTQIQFYATPLRPLSGGRTDVRFGGIAGQTLGRCTGGLYRDENLMDFYVLRVHVPVRANGKFVISQRSNGSAGPGSVKIVGAFIGTNGPRWRATIEVHQRQTHKGSCSAKREFRAKRTEQVG